LNPLKPASPKHLAEEIELKLALPSSDPSGLAKRLARIPLLARRKSTHLRLHNVYYDTPEQILREKRVALRLRRIGSEAKPRWLQTLKMSGQGDSALSRRGEWEVAVPSAVLMFEAIKQTPWSSIDPDGSVFQALVPCFVTTFERTSWTVRRRDRSVVEVSFDVGHISAGEKSAPICELEFELVAGQPQALFDIAQKIAGTIAVLPANMSKAERGYALAQDALNMPIRANPPLLTAKLPLPAAAQRVLREMFCHFTANLNALCTSDDPEVVHQARVGWRRFKTAWRLFRSSLVVDTVPSWQPLQPLLTFMGELRDLDVARTETLPSFAEVYTAGDVRRAEEWQALTESLQHAAKLQRKAVRYALQKPAVGVTLLATTQWLEGLSGMREAGAAEAEQQMPLPRWAKRRIVRLHDQLKRALKQNDNPDNQHRVRILSKRMRYGIEALRTLLPKKRTQRWYQQATSLQATLGAARDVLQASSLAAKLEMNRGLVEFLRGVAVGQTRPR
jgi:inorganic triphosphatase YgiF